jgi:hypothetical protein
MDIQAEKIELIRLLLETENEKIIQKVKAIFKKNTNDWWDETSEEERAAIEESIQQLAKGKGIPHKEVIKKYKKWL